MKESIQEVKNVRKSGGITEGKKLSDIIKNNFQTQSFQIKRAYQKPSTKNEKKNISNKVHNHETRKIKRKL